MKKHGEPIIRPGGRICGGRFGDAVEGGSSVIDTARCRKELAQCQDDLKQRREDMLRCGCSSLWRPKVLQGFGSSPEDHRRDFEAAIKNVDQRVRDVRYHLRGQDCERALQAFGNAEEELGAAAAHHNAASGVASIIKLDVAVAEIHGARRDFVAACMRR